MCQWSTGVKRICDFPYFTRIRASVRRSVSHHKRHRLMMCDQWVQCCLYDEVTPAQWTQRMGTEFVTWMEKWSNAPSFTINKVCHGHCRWDFTPNAYIRQVLRLPCLLSRNYNPVIIIHFAAARLHLSVTQQTYFYPHTAGRLTSTFSTRNKLTEQPLYRTSSIFVPTAVQSHRL
jgi:hypothetical protein